MRKEKKFGSPIPGVYQIFSPNTGVLLDFVDTGGLSDFLITGVYLIFGPISGILSDFPPKIRSLSSISLSSTINPGILSGKSEYYVSQEQNMFNNKIHWYSILLTFIFNFTARL